MIKAICSKKIIKDMVYYSYVEDIINDIDNALEKVQ